MAALYESKAHRASLRFVVFDVPVLAGVDLRGLPWQDRRERLELLARAFDAPFELSRVVEPSRGLAGGHGGRAHRGDRAQGPEVTLP
jgi:ATP-dependent DNA ligase